MTEQLHFSELWPHWPELLAGLWVTVQLTVLATIGGLAIGILGAAIRSGIRNRETDVFNRDVHFAAA
ncbi:hypothetical protein ACLBSJ_23965, partial [Klebsiella pneumoniae]